VNFVKNQLSSSLISLSPLITNHLHLLQQMWVQSSTCFYTTFNLFIISSLDFGFNWFNFQYFYFAFTSPILFWLSSLNLLTCWPIMQKVRQLFDWLLFISKFQVLFHSSFKGSFQNFLHSTLRYRLFLLYLSLESGLPFFKLNFSCSVLLFFIFYFNFIRYF